MTREDITLLKEIQKNTEMAMIAISTLSDKVEDDTMSYQLERQNLVFSNLHDHACDNLVQARQKLAPDSAMHDFMLKSGIHMNTLFNSSGSHIADIMIKGNVQGMTNLQRVINKQKKVKYFSNNQNEKKQSMALEMAQELMAFEESCIEKWKEFL